jgi:CheY-like chemotaxis protein
LSGRHVLVVDDDPSTRFLLRLIFEAAGYDVSEAQNGIAALIRIKGALPDLVVTDIMMPVMDGGALIEHLRVEPRTKHLPILAVSANPKARGVAARADCVLGKPFDKSDLLAAVEALLVKEKSIDR